MGGWAALKSGEDRDSGLRDLSLVSDPALGLAQDGHVPAPLWVLLALLKIKLLAPLTGKCILAKGINLLGKN